MIGCGAHTSSFSVDTVETSPRYKAAMELGRPLIPSAAGNKNEWRYTITPP